MKNKGRTQMQLIPIEEPAPIQYDLKALFERLDQRREVSQSNKYNNLLIPKESEVFAVAFALLAAGAVIVTLNILLLVMELSQPMPIPKIRSKHE
uniref:Uncharacterized protein n=1 Tax=Solanum lycopersicum TaxID=4081 RepID=A0A3Q7H931_SOLLC